jgi:hypothetical protein
MSNDMIQKYSGDPIGPAAAHFFCGAANSLRVSASTSDSRRKSFIVPISSITGHKKEGAALEIGFRSENAEQKALNGDREQPCDAKNGAGNGDVESAAPLIADHPAKVNQPQL